MGQAYPPDQLSRRIRLLHLLLLAFVLPFAASAATDHWLKLVDPVISPSEKKAYQALSAGERARFEEDFWANKSITAADYFKRLAYADAQWGSSQQASSANTDPGRVYLSLGAPTRITRLSSSRIFFPLEIWYYDTVPGLLNTELRLIFYQKNGVGLPHLYSPTTDTIRALLIPEAATRSLFGPNDSIDENKIRQSLNVPPAEDEVVSASVNVATGVRYSGNDEIIGRILSPRAMLSAEPKASVRSRLITEHPKVDFLLSASRYGGVQVDLSAAITAKDRISVEVADEQTAVYRNVLDLKFDAAKTVEYIHRLDLLPGSWRILIGVDGKVFPYPLEIPKTASASEIVRAAEADSGPAHAPFEFDSWRLYPAPDGPFALVTLPQPGEVRWTLRRGNEVVWRQKTPASDSAVAVLTLPIGSVPPGRYRLEAVCGDAARTLELDLGRSSGESEAPALLSFNANLAPADRFAQVGHQLMLRGDSPAAVASLEAALELAPLAEARVDLARIDALSGRWDPARDRVRAVLASDPRNFEALCVYAYVEAQLQDYPVAADLYTRALTIEDSPAVRLALSKLPH